MRRIQWNERFYVKSDAWGLKVEKEFYYFCDKMWREKIPLLNFKMAVSRLCVGIRGPFFKVYKLQASNFIQL